jgi:hypothetical protein
MSPEPRLYHHACAVIIGVFENVYTSNPFGSTQQLDKFVKHCDPDSPRAHEHVSIFNSTSASDYAGWLVKAGESGAVEFDAQGRRNIIVIASAPTGMTYRQGVPIKVTDSVKVVLSSNPLAVHAFPIDAANLVTRPCTRCNESVRV